MNVRSSHSVIQTTSDESRYSRFSSRSIASMWQRFLQRVRWLRLAIGPLCWIVVVCVTYAAAVPILLVQGEPDPVATYGDVRFISGERIRWQLNLDTCFSGEQSGFFGVYLSSSRDKQRSIRIASEDNMNFVITIYDADRLQAFNRDQADCSDFRVVVRRTGKMFAQISELEGQARLYCMGNDEEIEVNTSFKRCF